MKKSVFIKIFGGYFFTVFILAMTILLFSFQTIRSHYLGTLSRSLEKLGQALELRVIPLLEEGALKELDSLSREIAKQTQTRITIVNPDGKVLTDSEEYPEKMESHTYRPEIFQAFQGNIGKSIRLSPTTQEEMLYVALPLAKDGKIIGVLRLSLFLKDINKLLSDLKKTIFRVSGLLTIFLLFLAFFFSRTTSKPLQEIVSASHRVAAGDFSTKVILKSRDELQDLAQSFNAMTADIKTLFTRLSHQKQELESVVSSIQEGLMVLDRNGKILLGNESFKKIAETDLVEGKFYWEVIRGAKLDQLIKKVREEKKASREEITLAERTFSCRAAFMPAEEEIVLTFEDLTETQALEKIKRDFVFNVSHELRTPLTAIKGFTETLEAEADEKSQRYLGIIHKNTDRLIRIVEDLLLLSELEERGTRSAKEELKARDLIENVLKIFEPRARERELYLRLQAPEGLPLIKADPFLLEQMFINLIDNAIKFTEKGGITINLKIKKEDFLVEIEDTGIGISEEHLPRIFERFYVVDRSQSRRLGGTGLGLSIVKHIVLLHHGTIDVSSTVGKGTKFTITLPLF